MLPLSERAGRSLTPLALLLSPLRTCATRTTTRAPSPKAATGSQAWCVLAAQNVSSPTHLTKRCLSILRVPTPGKLTCGCCLPPPHHPAGGYAQRQSPRHCVPSQERRGRSEGRWGGEREAHRPRAAAGTVRVFAAAAGPFACALPRSCDMRRELIRLCSVPLSVSTGFEPTWRRCWGRTGSGFSRCLAYREERGKQAQPIQARPHQREMM